MKNLVPLQMLETVLLQNVERQLDQIETARLEAEMAFSQSNPEQFKKLSDALEVLASTAAVAMGVVFVLISLRNSPTLGGDVHVDAGPEQTGKSRLGDVFPPKGGDQ